MKLQPPSMKRHAKYTVVIRRNFFIAVIGAFLVVVIRIRKCSFFVSQSFLNNVCYSRSVTKKGTLLKVTHGLKKELYIAKLFC